MADAAPTRPDEALIDKYIDVPPHAIADARLRGYGVHVWALIGQLKALDWDVQQVAIDYELPCEAADAALAFYRYYHEYVDARPLLNSA